MVHLAEGRDQNKEKKRTKYWLKNIFFIIPIWIKEGRRGNMVQQ